MVRTTLRRTCTSLRVAIAYWEVLSKVARRPRFDFSVYSVSPRLHSLDFARIAAAGMVWVYHCCYLDPVFHNAPWSVDPILLGVAKYGYLGVPLFFMISGFVIANSALGRSHLQFAAARYWRLIPAISVCLAATGIVLVLQGDPPYSGISSKLNIDSAPLWPTIFGRRVLELDVRDHLLCICLAIPTG